MCQLDHDWDPMSGPVSRHLNEKSLIVNRICENAIDVRTESHDLTSMLPIVIALEPKLQHFWRSAGQRSLLQFVRTLFCTWLRLLLTHPAVSSICQNDEDLIIFLKIASNNPGVKKKEKTQSAQLLEETEMSNCLTCLLVFEPLNCFGAFPNSRTTCRLLHTIEMSRHFFFCLTGF
jgi:hypothetical protein